MLRKRRRRRGESRGLAPAARAIPTPPTTNAGKPVLFEAGNPDAGAIISGRMFTKTGPVNGTTLILESIPGLMSPADLCMFLQPLWGSIRHVRPLRLKTERNNYVAVVQVNTVEDATTCENALAGKPFLRGLVQNTCNIQEVLHIEFDGANDNDVKQFPSEYIFPVENTELQACPVCLEPMATDAPGVPLVTTLCCHTMHASCLAKWDHNRCPVCRHTHELTPEASTCMNCDYRDDLWMCVICAYVGCGVYKKKHAHQHFAETQHPFAMNLEDCVFWTGETLKAGSVWDYVSERFVTRLITSDDGKIVEVSPDEERNGEAGSSSSGSGSSATCCRRNQPSDPMIIDGAEENDRSFQAAVYASRMDAIVDDYRRKLKQNEAEHNNQIERLESEIAKLRADLDSLSKEKKALRERVSESEKKSKSITEKNTFLKNLNESLLRDKQGWKEQVETLKAQLNHSRAEGESLKEQLHDLMMHLEAQAKIAAASSGDSCRSDAAELMGGDVRVGPSARQRLAMKTNRRGSG